ncbi:immune inhibitor A [Kitasatospora sp. YST-16]|uniref:immune inhibitor A domain-containing protein n=1 Tax=unclassified Kitasatospora TaxID=2633591 RepID=UPI0004C36E4F|nr:MULTISPECIES: immune inhibitor A domain-containing protein [unclassified Kitasatospora]WAL75522.1 immune inhibitor A [Kitasatospora sp. YST-16]WNW41587.1 immune inhibitor A [Streptomyces sp. Li-HN-5-13]
MAALTTGAIALTTTPAFAQPHGPAAELTAQQAADGREAPPSPLPPQEKARQALKAQALAQVNQGKVAKDGKSAPAKVKVGNDYVQLANKRTDKVFVILAQFGDQVDDTTQYNGQARYGGTPGPKHDAIPKPDRSDTHTYWESDFSRDYYQKMFFDPTPGANSMRNFYRTQSSGRYDIQGTVTDWVTVPWNEARYGSNKGPQGGGAWTQAQEFIRDATKAWYDGEIAKGRTAADVKAELAQYDTQDRYDYDKDGDFDEPDGYLDNLVVVHAGVDETWGGGAQGGDALWAHRSWAFSDPTGRTGPAGNKIGGVPLGDSGLYAYDYVQAGENSGVGLFSHEYGHNLGLPDLYPTTGGDNSVSFWSLMSSASYLGKGKNTTGEYPGDLDAWSKLQMGWLDYDEAQAATRSSHTLGVSGYHTDQAQAVLVHLPPSTTTTSLADPYEGGKQWWSDTGDNLDAVLSRTVDLTGATDSAALDAAAWWDTEQDYDFFTIEGSTDGGRTWTPLHGTVDGQPIGDTPALTPGLSGTSNAWQQLHVPLDAYLGKSVQVRFHVTSDSNTHGKGVLVDAVRLTADGSVLLSDGAENGDNGWTEVGFSAIRGKDAVQQHPRAYLVENRRYAGYGAFLKTGPYNFGYSGVPGKANVIDTYPYQEGVLVWLWDTGYGDNNTADHPGGGLILPVDAHPKALRFADGSVTNGRSQPYDAPFSLKPTTGFTLHKAGAATEVPSEPAVPAFDDHSGVYTDPALPQLGVRVPDTGTRIEVVRETQGGRLTTVKVGPVS